MLFYLLMATLDCQDYPLNPEFRSVFSIRNFNTILLISI